MILGDVATVRAEVRQVSPSLPPADTLSATLHFAGGALGSYLVSYAVGAFWEDPLQIVGTAGSMRVDRGWIEIAQAGGRPERRAVAVRDGVDEELAAFVDSVLEGKPHANTPSEALRDLAVIEAMLQSAASGRVENVG
jgi:predicted dehydrogenase